MDGQPLSGGSPGVPDPHAPDDARELARDAEALRRERRAQVRRRRVVRLLTSGTGARSGVPATLVLAVLLVVAVFAALPVVLRPAGQEEPPPRPLASPAVAPGSAGGLLPDVLLRTPTGNQRVRDTVRPAVLVLVPPACGCDAAVEQAVRQARQFTRNVRLVTDGRAAGADAQADRLRVDVIGGLARSAVDPAGTLTEAYAARGVTVLALADDGVVLHVLRDVRPEQRLERELRDVVPAGTH